MAEPEKVIIKDAVVEGVKDEEKVLIEKARVEGTAEKLPQPSKPPDTTEQEDITTAGQRRVNLIWEYTQAVIAIVTVGTTMASAIIAQFQEKPVPTIIAVAFGSIVGFYFARTNHQAIGGVGKKPTQEYQGR